MIETFGKLSPGSHTFATIHVITLLTLEICCFVLNTAFYFTKMVFHCILLSDLFPVFLQSITSQIIV